MKTQMIWMIVVLLILLLNLLLTLLTTQLMDKIQGSKMLTIPGIQPFFLCLLHLLVVQALKNFQVVILKNLLAQNLHPIVLQYLHPFFLLHTMADMMYMTN